MARKKKVVDNQPVSIQFDASAFIEESRRQEDGLMEMLLGAMGDPSAAPFGAMLGSMGVSFGSIAMSNLIMQETRLFNLHEPGTHPDIALEIPVEQKRYADQRANLRASLGADFETVYKQARDEDNECRVDMGRTPLPEFNEDGTFKNP